MKHLIQSLLRRLDLRVTRASTFERLLNETAALGRKVAELQADLDGVGDSQQGNHAEIGNENIDRILARISAAGTTIPPNEFAEICTDYSAVRTSGGRGRVSVQLLSHLLSSPSSADVLSDPVVQPLTAHELYRQAAATRDLARGSLDQSLTAWKQISDNLPSPFNLACYARALSIKGDKRNAFFVLSDAVDRYPHSVTLARDLAMFFARLGEIEAADKALEPIRHAFLDERNALAIQQAELDRGLDEEWIGDKAAESTLAALWQEQHRRLLQCNEFQDPLAARDANLRRMIGRIVRDAGGAISTVIEFNTICAHTIARLSREHAHVEFISLQEDDVAALNAPLLDGANVLGERGGPDALTAATAGNHALLFHAGTEDRSYPAKLANLYGRCRELRIRHLVIGETLDFDRESLHYHAPGKFPRITRLGAGARFLHDFSKLLDDAGYVIADLAALPPCLVPRLSESDAGYRLLHAVARD